MKLKQCSVCGEMTQLWKSKPPTCKKCYRPTPIKRDTNKLSKEIKVNKEYYNAAIQKNVELNGYCKCENCGDTIINPTGRNVSHIIAKGTNKSLYLNPLNNFVLCLLCEDTWTNGDRTKMRVFPESQTRKFNLLNEFYLKGQVVVRDS